MNFYDRRFGLDDRGPRFSPRSAFLRAKKLETNYAARLRKIAGHVSDVVREFSDGSFESALFIGTILERYAQALEPWAEVVSDRMVKEAAQRDEMAWKKAAAEIGRSLQTEIMAAPTGAVMRGILAEQVTLIKSLPLEAAQRVHDMTIEGISKGQRAAVVAAKILETGDVTRSRAMLIARTETARTSAILTQVRAQHIGSEGYIWRTANDSDVRPSHRAMRGKFVRWDDPPELDGMTGHAGCFPNCRCFAEPQIPD